MLEEDLEHAWEPSCGGRGRQHQCECPVADLVHGGTLWAEWNLLAVFTALMWE